MKTESKRELRGQEVASPVGTLTLLASAKGLAGIYFEDRYYEPWERGESVYLAQAAAELAEYFAGERREFSVQLDPVGTEFQRSVWSALLTVGFGERASYLDIANLVGNPKAVRAVGMANGANPISILVPCHRIVGSNGSLTGYGGGLERKNHLLRLEENFAQDQFALQP